MTPNDKPLFTRSVLSFFSEAEDAMKQAIEKFDANELLNTPVTDLVSRFVSAHAPDPIELETASVEQDYAETTIDSRSLASTHFHGRRRPSAVPATATRFYVPFTGDPVLFELQPSWHTMNAPRAEVRGSELVLTLTSLSPEPGQLRGAYEAALAEIQSHLQCLQRDLEGFRARLSDAASKQVTARRDRLLRAQNVAAALPFPLRRRTDGPNTYAPPSVRQKITPSTRSSAPNTPFSPEPTLPEEEYEHILHVMQTMTHVLERSPSAFVEMDEETIRQHFLVQLNGHYEGAATGETFNCAGKTDILVRDRDKNIFIAECKFWRGPVGFAEAIDQLLSYAAWRDTKTAIILFNRGKQLSGVLAKIPECLRSHPNFKRGVTIEAETRFRAVFRHLNDASRELTITVLVFEVPE